MAMAMDNQSTVHQKLRKTKLCSFLQEGRCLRGDNCTYAHSQAELEDQPDLSKTFICMLWKAGKCKHSAESCRFAHGKRNLRVLPERKQGKESSSGLAQLGNAPVKIQVSELSSLLAPMASEHEAKEVDISMAPAWASVPCTSRRPTVGDRVKSLVGEVTLEDAHGNEGAWKLTLGEFAIVSAVDEDGDFRLRNVHRIESCFSFRKDYAYIGMASKVPGHDECTYAEAGHARANEIWYAEVDDYCKRAMWAVSPPLPETWAVGYWPELSHWEDCWQSCIPSHLLEVFPENTVCGFEPPTKPLAFAALPEECNTIESSTESTELGGTASGNASEDDCSSLGSDDIVREVANGTQRAVTPPPGLCLPEEENSGSDADESEDGIPSSSHFEHQLLVEPMI